MTVRWSNAGGNAAVPDPKPDIRGMAVKFHLPDGTVTDLLGQTSPRFPTDDPEEFVALTEASERAADVPAVPGPAPEHAAVDRGRSLRARSIARRHSFAEVTFYPIHAYGWLAADGTPHLGALHLPARPRPRRTGSSSGSRARDRLRRGDRRRGSPAAR